MKVIKVVVKRGKKRLCSDLEGTGAGDLLEKVSIPKWLIFGNVPLSSLSGEHGVLKVVSS